MEITNEKHNVEHTKTVLKTDTPHSTLDNLCGFHDNEGYTMRAHRKNIF